MATKKADKAEKTEQPEAQAAIENNFTYHPPKSDQAERYARIRDKAKELATMIVMTTPDSRERALALTNLEQAVMWVNAGIARNE